MSKKILRTSLILIMAISVSVFAACKGNKEEEGKDKLDNQAPTLQPEDNLQDKTDNNEQAKLSVKDYYPIQADVEYIYSGEGNEFAAYNRIIDYISEDGSRVQIRTNNSGTETVRVIEVKDGKISVIKTVNECYYRDNLLNSKADGQAEILLMEPLTEGTQWTLADGRKRHISGTDVEINTPSGTYRAIEVTTEADDSIVKDYYAYGVGLVKTVFASGGSEVISELSKINKDAVYSKTIDIFYPGVDENIYVQPITITFKTGDISRLLIQEALTKEAAIKDFIPLASTKTKINSLYLGEDGIAYIDFSAELVTEMTVGSGYEELILQCITNTVGNYYGTDEVYLTVEGKPYKSGHIYLEKGETLKVDMSRVKE